MEFPVRVCFRKCPGNVLHRFPGHFLDILGSSTVLVSGTFAPGISMYTAHFLHLSGNRNYISAITETIYISALAQYQHYISEVSYYIRS